MGKFNFEKKKTDRRFVKRKGRRESLRNKGIRKRRIAKEEIE